VRARARRLATLEALSDVRPLDVTAAAARVWALMRVHLAQTGRRVRVNDLWIASVAVANKLPVRRDQVTQYDDFEPVRGVAGLEVVKV
jgi:predicted nucleic acid-binding protein